MTVDVELKILDPRLGDSIPLPQAATLGSAGMDLRAAVDAPLTLAPGESVLVPSGMAIHIGDPGWCALIVPRSGLGHKHGLVMGNLLVPVAQARLRIVDEFVPSQRGEGGFGSTGKH